MDFQEDSWVQLSLRKAAVRLPSLKCERTDSTWAGLTSEHQLLTTSLGRDSPLKYNPRTDLDPFPHEPWWELKSYGKWALRKAHGALQTQIHLPSTLPAPAAPHCALPFLHPCLTLHFPKLEARLIPPYSPKRVSSPNGSKHARRPPREYSIISLLLWI